MKNTDDARKIANAYITATYEGDSKTLRSLFAETATMSGYLKGELVVGTPEPFFAQMESNPSLKSGGAPYEATIDHLHVSGNIGSVTISETGFGDMAFVNYLHLLRVGDNWLIVSKTFESR